MVPNLAIVGCGYCVALVTLLSMSLGDPTILIVEDDDVTAGELDTELTGAGYVVWRAGTAHDALVALESRRPDLILVSLMLPDTDGLILCTTLRSRISAPIIILTARESEVDRALALESGAFDCLTRPVDRDELVTRVHAALQSSVCRPA
jgi:DNA-binding response OmpR family regulator